MIEALITLHIFELGVAVMIIPFVAVYIYVALKARRNNSSFLEVFSIILLIGLIGGLVFLTYGAFFCLILLFFPPSY